jgi:hypothetical protein
MNWLFDFIFGLVIGRTARNTALTARNTAEIAKFAAMSEAQKAAYQIESAKREKYLAGQRRFVFITLGVILAVVWVVGALVGGN